MLGPDDPLPAVRRVLVAGVTGSGKTTLARRLGAEWRLRHVEIDALFHGPNWTPRPRFLDDVRDFAAEDRWITEWQYWSQGTDALLAPRAELVVWLDYPYRVVRSRLIRRTLRRSILRTKLWNGNVEPPIWKWFSKPEDEDILRWQTATLQKWHERMPGIESRYPQLTILRLRHPRETKRWLDVHRSDDSRVADPTSTETGPDR
ncbi:P-loop NTPase family protein [Rathayibacter sp. CAU 1779]